MFHLLFEFNPTGACCWVDKQTIAAVDIPLLIDRGVSHTQQQSVDHRKEMVSNEPRNMPIMVSNECVHGYNYMPIQ